MAETYIDSLWDKKKIKDQLASDYAKMCQFYENELLRAERAEQENAELLKQNEGYDKLGLEALELKRERNKYHRFLLHLYGNQQELDDILKKFEDMKGIK